MSNRPDDDEKVDSQTALEMDFRSANFPSDSLSVKRFRTLFPAHFDQPDTIGDGYASNDFFWPSGDGEPKHLAKLTKLICDERLVASGAFYRCYLDRYPELLNHEDLHWIEVSKRQLEDSYQQFRLADSPESARLLIRQVEEEGERQALQDQARGR